MSPELAMEFVELMDQPLKPVDHESLLGSGPITGWLYSLERFGKEAYVRIAIALAHELLHRSSTPQDHLPYLRTVLWTAEDWAIHPDRQTLDAAIRVASEAQEFLVANDIAGYEDPRETALAAVWAAAARQAFPPRWALTDIETWHNNADDCAFEGAAYACEIFHYSSSNADQLVTLNEINGIIKVELRPWLLADKDPLAVRAANRT